MLTASDLHAEYGDNTIFEGLSLTLSGDRRVGLVGPNGAGKTTLLRLLAGVDAPERGAVTLGPGDRIGYLPQEPPGPELTIDRLLGAALGEVWRLHGELERLESRLEDPAALAAYGEAQERFGGLGGWALQAQLDGARAALGIGHVPLDAPLGSLSGGEAARALLAGVLLARPTILLLDEPTNHLDLDGLAWLEEFLTGFPGAVLVVSHDRQFLDTTVTQILELDVEGLTLYEGGYSAYRDEKARRRERLELDYEAQQKRRRRLEADITATRGYAMRTETTVSRAEAPRLKRYAKKVARKAQARERRLQRELDSETNIDKPRHTTGLKIELDGGGRGRLVAALRGVTAGWDDPLLRDVDLTIRGRDRIAITGPNGAGKTTLLDVISGRAKPESGRVIFGNHTDLLPLVENEVAALGIGRKFQTPSVFVNLSVWDNVELSLKRARMGVLAALFERDGAAERDRIAATLDTVRLGGKAIHRAGALSHGEKQWLEIGMVMAQDPELLLVDEPVAGMTEEETARTGELLQSIAADRSVLVIEHDMDFVRQIARTVTVLHQGAVLCEGQVEQVQSDPRVLEVYLGHRKETETHAHR